MDNVIELKQILLEIHENDIKLWIENDLLKYKAPKGKMKPEILLLLKEHKEEIIKYLINLQDFDDLQSKRIEVISKQELYELSNAQRRLWVLDQFEEESITYNMPASFILEGELKTEAFKQAYSFMLKRHESLRTVFVIEDGEARQMILENPEYKIELIDLRENRDAEKEARIHAKKDLFAPFNLETGPLVRFSIVGIEDEKHLLLFNMHHIISDGWSMNIFIREFLQCYNSFRNGDSPDIKPLRIHYKDYSAWQNDLLESDDIDNQKNYWLDKLSGELPVLNLPTDYFRPTSQTFNGNCIGFSLSKEFSSGLNNLCRINNVSLFMMLQTLVKVLLYRYTGQNDIILGSPVAGRVHEDLEDQIGFYVNTLILRDTIEGDLLFTEILERVKKTSTEAFDNQIYPFDRIVDDLDIGRDLSRSPLFDVMVVLQNNESTSIEFEGLELIPYNNDNVISKFDMTFNFSESEEDLFCGLEYNTDIYAEDRIERMVQHFKTLISSVLENPNSRIKDLEIIPVDEKNLLLNVFNDTKTDYPSDRTIIQLFEEQVEKVPDNIAIVFEDVELSYKELNGKANIVGHYLRDNYDIKPDDLVGVMLERSERMIVALLGILKSGAAYVPIDPEYPEERIRYMLEDSNPQVVISEKIQDLKTNTEVIDVVKILESEQSTLNPVEITNSDNLIYVIYTSGSTGKPKGSAIRHHNFNNLLKWYTTENQLHEYGKLLLVTSFSFDLTQKNLYAPLITGNNLVISSAEVFNPVKIINEISDYEIRSINCTPGMFYEILEASETDKYIKLITLQNVFLGGEPIDFLQVDKWRNSGNCNATIINTYGPTECTDICLSHKIDWNKENKIIPLGTPIYNSKTFLIDKNQGLVPIGIPGELCISGTGLGAGYINLPDLTAEKFLDNPFNPGEGMYRTGDLARWLPCGNIEFLGRIDNQVKIRGFRIELGEIEKTFIQYENISSSIVLAKDGMNGDKQLAAYYVSEKKLEISDIENFLAKSLPDYMIPTFFIHMDAIKLTHNGKIDRKSLPELDGIIKTSEEYVAPRNEIERRLLFIWQEVLGINKIGVLDNFFRLGGHSLKATRIVSRISKELGVNVKLKEIFENPTIETLSRVIHSLDKREYKKIEAVACQDSYVLSNAQRRLWVLDQLEEGSIAYNIPASFSMRGELNIDSFKQAYSYMLERHESLRTVFIVEDGVPKQKILDNPEYKIELIDLSEFPEVEQEVQALVVKDHMTTFNLETGPLVRFTIIRLEDEKFLLLFNMHHIISDGWSMSIFINEFLTSYNSFREGITPELTPLRIHYKDYSIWQNRLLESEEMNSQREYWLDKLSGELPVLDLPADNIRSVNQTFNGNNIGFVLQGEINSDLKDLCLENKVSLFMMIQALVKVLFHRYTGQDDIILGSPIAGRVHEDLENQIGFYVNTLSLRDTIEGDLTFKEFLVSVKKTCTDAFDNQDFPFDRLVEELDIKRDMSRSPLFDVLVGLQNNEKAAVEFDGLNLSPYNTENTISKFDMTFNFSESDGILFCDIEYNTDIYAVDRIERMVEHFKTLIFSVLDNPEVKVKDLKIIPDEEKNLLLKVFNDTKVDYPRERTIVDLFEEQVDKTPDNIAVVFENVELTYRELNEKANIVGHYLRDNYAIKPDDLIGVLVDRSDKSIIVLLGILKSGAGYVPIDPEYPQERINYMIEDSRCFALISQKSLQLSFSDISTKTIFFDDIEQGIGLDKKYNLTLDIKPNNLMYIIYTSGSTGNPKGVMIEHRNIVNLAISQIRKFGITEDEHILQFSSLCFDASVEQINISLLSGATLFLITKDMLLDEDLFSDFIIENRLTHIHAVPTFIKTIKNRNYPSLKRIIAGGDVCPVELAKKWISTCTVYNEYGPTETAVTSTEREFLNYADIGDHIDIGKPISNTQIFIVDEYNNIQPVGIPGEMCIAGAGVARGYLNDDELTKLKFIDNPFGEGFLYKTGDLAKLLPDGNIDFLGRIDNQVKINGFRIECTEIENSLRSFNNKKNNYLKQCKEFYTSEDLRNVKRCKKCLISGNFPGAKINENGICSFCDEFEEYKEEANLYFKGIPALEEIIKRVKEEDIEYDCMLLFSGGKDSSYVLYRLVELGLKVLAFTFDNGYISDTAFSNIKRITSKLGVDSLICNNDNMNQIFVESLHLDHTVCGGCFQALTTVSTKVAIDKGIKMVFTGLSRGQIFDTKLHGLFTQEIYDIDVIEEKLLDFRKLYHSKNDKINKLLNIELNNNDLNSINFIDFFRYEYIKVDEIKKYLQEKDEYWTQPGDTGFCSTNCTINDVGIYFHTNELSYHNYEGPLSWDIRLGVSKRTEIIDEVLYYPDLNKTLQIANDIGYSNPKIGDTIVIDREDSNGNRYLCAYIMGDEKISIKKIRKYLSKSLPDYMIPSFFIHMETLPLTPNGKIDRKALPDPDGKLNTSVEYVAPRNDIEEVLVGIWEEVLGVNKIGINDNFFDLGGQSLKAVQIISRIKTELLIDLRILDFYFQNTISELAEIINSSELKELEIVDNNEEIEDILSLIKNN